MTKRKRREVRDAAERIKDQEAFFRRWGLNERDRSRLEGYGAPEVYERLARRRQEKQEATKPNAPAEQERAQRGARQPNASAKRGRREWPNLDVLVDFLVRQQTVLKLIDDAALKFVVQDYYKKTLGKAPSSKTIETHIQAVRRLK